MPPFDPTSFLRKFRIATIAIAVALICLVLLVLRMGKVTRLEEQITTETEVIERMERNLANAKSLEAQLETMERLTSSIETRILQPGDASINISYFYGFENEDVRIVSVDQNIRQSAGPWKMTQFQPVAFQIEATGDFHNLLDLAYRIRTGPKLVRITAISIQPGESSTSDQRRAILTVMALGSKE